MARGSGQVGRLSVRVLPDTTKFRRDLKTAVEKAEKTVTANIEATVNVTKASLANAKRQLEGVEARVPVFAEVSEATREYVEEQLDGIDATADVAINTDSKIASARVRHFTRPRVLPVHIEISKASLAKAAAAIAALSGGRVLGDFARNVTNAVKSLDRAMPVLATVSTLIVNLGAVGLAATSNILALGASLASIAPAAIALPGILTGFGVGLGVMVAALVDAGDVLSDLGPKFAALQDTISAEFWEQAAQPIRDLANNALPMLNDRLGEVGGELGGFFASLANAFNTPDNLGAISTSLGYLRDSIGIASEGIADFVDGLVGIGEAGASYLPQLAGWFNDISASFSDWVQTNTDSGQLFTWIDTGIAALQDLGRVLGATGGILGGFATAASNAGGASLGALADGLEGVNEAINGPVWQGALETVFRGAHDAMTALGPGVSALGDAFVNLAPVLAEIMVLAGEIGSTALSAISAAFEDPAFQGGLTAFFEGLQVGVEALAPHIPALASAFGSVASFAGTLAAVLGPVLGAAIEALAPVVEDLMVGLSAIAPVLGGVLVAAIEAVAPLIQNVVGAITDWIAENPEFAAGLAVAAGAVGALIAAIVPLVGALLPLLFGPGSIPALATSAGGLSAAFSSVAGAIGTFLGPVLAVVGIITALAGALVYAWTQSAAFREAVMGLFEGVMGFLQPIIAFIMNTVVPIVVQVAQAFLGMVTTILDALIPMWTVILQIFTEILNILTPVVSFVLSVLAPVFTFLGDVVSAAFTFIGAVISSVINVITSILQVFLAVLQGDWSAAWAAVKNVARTVWEGIKTTIGAAIDFVWSVIQSGLSMIKSIWNTVWGAVRDFVVNLWNSIVSKVTAFVRNLANSIRNKVNEIKNKVRDAFNRARDIAVDAFQRLVSGVTNKIGDLLGEVRALPGKIKDGLGNLANLLYSAGKDVIRGLVDGIKNMAGAAVDAAKGVVGDAVNGAKNLLGIASPSKVFMEIGEHTGEGMIIGLEHKAKGVNKAMTAMVRPPSLPQGDQAGIRGYGVAGDGGITVNVQAPSSTNDPGTWGRRVANSLDLNSLAASVGGA